MIGAILFAVILYVITTELWLFVTRQRRWAVFRKVASAARRFPAFGNDCANFDQAVDKMG